MIIIKQVSVFFFSYNICDNNVRLIKNRNTRRKSRKSRPQKGNSIVTPPLALNAIVAQRGASVGIIQVSKKRKSWGMEVGPQDRQA